MRKHIIISLSIFTLLIISLQAYSQTKANALDINKTVELLKSNSSITIIDVRTPDEIKETGSIKNSVNIDFKADDFKAKVSKLDKNKTYLIYCRSGNRAGQASKIMIDLGFKNINYLKNGDIVNYQKH